MFIPCQKCGQQYTEDWTWYVCDTCGYRICPSCFGSHSGPGNGYNSGGNKCSQCQTGWLHLQHGIRNSVESTHPKSKLDEYLQRVRGEELPPCSHEERCEYTPNRVDNSELLSYRTSNSKATGIIITNTQLIAKKYKSASAQDVRELIQDFINASYKMQNFLWEFIDLGSEEMTNALEKDASWMDYAQLLADFSEVV